MPPLHFTIREALAAHLVAMSSDEAVTDTLRQLVALVKREENLPKQILYYEALTSAGFLPLLRSVLQKHPDCADVQHLGYSVVRRLVTLVVNKNLGQPDHLREILETMSRHAPNLKVQKSCCGVLWHLAAYRENQHLMFDFGVVDTVCRTLRLHLASHKLVQIACATIWNLAVDDRNELSFVQQGSVVPLILEGMQMHPSQALLQQRAMDALFNLSFNPLNKKKIFEFNVVPAVIQAMRTHRTHEGVQLTGNGVIWNLAENEEVLQALLSEQFGLVDLLHRVRVDFYDNKCVLDRVEGALKALKVPLSTDE